MTRIRSLTRLGAAAATAVAAFLVALAFHETPSHAKAGAVSGGSPTTSSSPEQQSTGGLTGPSAVPQAPTSSGRHLITGQT